MKHKLALKALLCLLYTLCYYRFSAQACGPCTNLITGADNQSYTVTSGQTFCVDTLGEFTGTLVLNGGLVCNKGVLNPSLLALSSGSLSNFALLKFDSLSLTTGVFLLNGISGLIRLEGGLTVDSATFENAGIVEVGSDLTFTSGAIINSSIVKCRYLLGSSISTISNTGIINHLEP